MSRSSTTPPTPVVAGGTPANAHATAAAYVPKRPIHPFLQPLRFMGVPASVLRWQPKLPSRNWLILLSTTGTLASLYVYDRRECNRIRQEYKDRVKHLAQEKLEPNQRPRKLLVYCAQSPGDEDYNKSVLYFKKFVKPILVAAAIDWELTNGVRHGGLARLLRERIFARRRQMLGLEAWGTPPSCVGASSSDQGDINLMAELNSAVPLTPQMQLQRELDGATVIVGRPAFKEYMWGLQQGWTLNLPPLRTDLDAPLAQRLAEDSAFDEIKEENSEEENAFNGFVGLGDEDQSSSADAAAKNAAAALSAGYDGEEADGAGAPLPSRFVGSRAAGLAPLGGGSSPFLSGAASRAAPAEASPLVDASLLEPPSRIPAQPPLALIPYTNLVGLKHMPRRIVRWFTQRNMVREGGEAALAIALGSKDTAREFQAPAAVSLRSESPQGGDLDFALDSEGVYPSRWHKMPTEIEKARESYYRALPRRLKDTRTLMRGEREPSALEKNDPPKTEQELREERLKKEREWADMSMAHAIIKVSAGVAWSEAFRGSLRVLERVATFPSTAESEGEALR